MISKAQLRDYKENDIDALYASLRSCSSSLEARVILENLGRLPKDFDGEVLIPFLNDAIRDTRYWAVKNLGKLEDIRFLRRLSEVAIEDASSTVRREAVSAIGRMRNKHAIPTLVKFLHDDDPNVVLQAIRALLVFKSHERVRDCLRSLRDHPNEQIRYVLDMEFESKPSISDYGMHHESPDYMKNVVVEGDTREVMRLLPDGCIHLTFTSPPYYNARDYSIYKSYQQYLDFLGEVFEAVHRITKEGRFLLINTSPVIVSRFSRKHSSRRYPIPFDLHNIVCDLDWEFIDDIVWAKPEASVKNRNGGFQQHRKPLGYKPNMTTEYVMVYRKKSSRLIDWNMRQYPKPTVEESKVKDDFETTNLWHIDPMSDAVHTAVFPHELCDKVVKFYSYVGDLVFDPFAGSGTFGQSAKRLKRYFFLTEQEPKFVSRMKDMMLQNQISDPAPRFVSREEFKLLAERSQQNAAS
ncbi:MAG: DNA methyltransferase [Chloroflexota bacterium]|nr:DNA methyltransferase [Chloroflexota bacterium]MDE2858588.1 DNA methyltransferase [Chloroflexota bacterium]MDE2949522.1 DNA methyltransferase [Chloroflexota bacterium]